MPSTLIKRIALRYVYELKVEVVFMGMAAPSPVTKPAHGKIFIPSRKQTRTIVIKPALKPIYSLRKQTCSKTTSTSGVSLMTKVLAVN